MSFSNTRRNSQPATKVSESRIRSRKQPTPVTLLERTEDTHLDDARIRTRCSLQVLTQTFQSIFPGGSHYSTALLSCFPSCLPNLLSCLLLKALHSLDFWTNSNGSLTLPCLTACPYSPPLHQGQKPLLRVLGTHPHPTHIEHKTNQIIRRHAPLRPHPHLHLLVLTRHIITTLHAPSPFLALLKSDSIT